MEYIEKQCPLEYVENDWENFLSEKANGERVRYFKFFRLIPCDAATEGCINAFKNSKQFQKMLLKVLMTPTLVEHFSTSLIKLLMVLGTFLTEMLVTLTMKSM